MPEFGGAKGNEIINNLEEIKISFRKSLEKIKGHESD